MYMSTNFNLLSKHQPNSFVLVVFTYNLHVCMYMYMYIQEMLSIDYDQTPQAIRTQALLPLTL